MPPPPRAAAAAAARLLLARRHLASSAAGPQPPPPPPRRPTPRRVSSTPLPWTKSTFARTALPMFGFVVAAWFGLEQLIDSKLRIRAGVRGHDRLEEYDPLERIRRMATAADGKAGGERKAGGPAEAAAATSDGVPSLEDELEEMNRKLGDTRKFEYVPVPRTDEDEDEG